MEKQEKYMGGSEAEKNCMIKQYVNLTNKITSEDLRNQIKGLAKRCQLCQMPGDNELEGIIKRIHDGLKQWPDQTPFYQTILKSYPEVEKKDGELKEKGEI